VAHHVGGFFDLEFDGLEFGEFSAVDFVVGEGDHVLAIVRELNFAYGLAVLQLVELFPLAFVEAEAQHLIVAPSAEQGLAIARHRHRGAEFAVLPEFPVLLGLPSCDELLLELFKVHLFCLHLVLFLLLIALVILLLDFLLARVVLHGVDDVIVDHPDVEVLISCH
jgi:hypothetical protein